jgi:hypothetical protein
MSFLRSLRRRLADLPRIMWLWRALARRILPEPVTRSRFAAARFVFILGMNGLCFEVKRQASVPAA